jgi:hypothetical protein
LATLRPRQMRKRRSRLIDDNLRESARARWSGVAEKRAATTGQCITRAAHIAVMPPPSLPPVPPPETGFFVLALVTSCAASWFGDRDSTSSSTSRRRIMVAPSAPRHAGVQGGVQLSRGWAAGAGPAR